MKINNILVVCVGNICRSPTAELLLKQAFPNKQIGSAGVGALVGKPMDASALQLAIDAGLDGRGHVAQQLTADMAKAADLILVMEKGHIEAVTSIAPFAMGKTFLYGKPIGDQAIPDPYRQSVEAFQHVFQLLCQATEGWRKFL
ncbi:low molecular weight protein-tyrosine-phosphatase [Paraferrimonas sp. SM1919]|uniref:low molecular weight protein-tyrosine-phosphatase n=1 Tax=Paraferrimonas sp. SM1919 TaxID=2662263 RepID=UPI0013D26EFD|nr:low molecular weight protein-tyrosine-phosphatase [Paraferrimonas sp. SM1919]